MRFKDLIILCLVLVTLVFIPRPVSAFDLYPPYYDVYLNLGIQALNDKDYDSALYFFKEAQIVNPDSVELNEYINYLNHLKDGHSVTRPSTQIQVNEQYVGVENEPTPQPISIPTLTNVRSGSRPSETSVGKAPAPVIPQKPIEFLEEETVYLNDELWATQPKTLIRIALNSSVILEGENIERFLDVTPGFVLIERINRDQIKVTASQRGTTFAHVWDDTGRWTFNFQIIFPNMVFKKVSEEKLLEEQSPNFRFKYDADWSASYDGPSLDDAERSLLTFYQSFAVEGETPYGVFDAWTVVDRLSNGDLDNAGYGVGLTDGKIGRFKNFSIRGFDTNKSFSRLSVPGQHIHGVTFEQTYDNERFEFEYLRGRSRSSFGFLASSGNDDDRFVEGARFVFSPNESSSYAFNFARGWGEDRADFLSDRVFSFQTENKLFGAEVESEWAFDEDQFATTVKSAWRKPNSDFVVSLRNMEPGFTTISGRPSSQGETGVNFDLNYRWEDVRLDSNVDLFHEREFPNEEDPDGINLDTNISVAVDLDKNKRLRSSIYYLDTPQLLAPRKNFRWINNYTQYFSIFGDRKLSLSTTGTYQRSRFKFSPDSEYDRISISNGIRFPIIPRLDYYLNYEYSWVDEQASGETLNPSVLTSGLYFSNQFNDKWRVNSSLTYRDEEDTEGNNSFLAGEDSISANVGVSYQPKPGLEIFANGRLRNVWTEEAGTDAQHEFDIRFGMRSDWELPFSWSPKGEIMGMVYKDENDNGQYDEGEEGIPNITVNVGNQEYVTNDQGEYYAGIRAKSAVVTVQVDDLPQGFVLSSKGSVDTPIEHKRTKIVDFGITTQSGIYGIVYYDFNTNGRPDPNDELVSGVKITLDGSKTKISDFEGTYAFRDVKPGRHIITLDVNSIPIEYLPQVKVRNEIEVSEGITYVYHIPLKKAKK